MRFPKEGDWTKSPFTRPPKFRMSISPIGTINGMFVSTQPFEKYLVVAGQKKDKIYEFWLMITIANFHKPILVFQEGNVNENLDSQNKYNVSNIVQVKDVCPACEFKLSEEDKSCPNCGLNFE